jgi:cytochrome c oxidase subunit 3
LAATEAALAPQFESLEQQHETNVFGMWVFLLTELMLFGGIFTAYATYRYFYPDAFVEGSRHLNLTLATINTVVLIASSLMMALAVRSAQVGSGVGSILFLALTGLLGAAFLGIKGVEYYEHYLDHTVPGLDFAFAGPHAPQVQIFFMLYFAMTGVHALHMIIGIGIVIVMMVRSFFGHFSPDYYSPIEMAGLYWHFVDIVWIFLFPLLYLVARH